MNSMIIIFFVAVSTAYCSVLPLGGGLIGGGAILGAPVASGIVSAGIATPIISPIAAPIATPILTKGISSGAILAGPSGTVATKNGIGLVGGIGLL